MNIKRRIFISVAAQIASQIFAGVIGVIVLKIMTTSLGPDKYGIYATAMAFISTFALLTDLGVKSVTVRELAKYPNKAAEIIGYNMGLRLLLCLVMIPVISAIGFLVYPHGADDLRLCIFLASLTLCLDAVWAISAAYFTAQVRNEVPAKLSMVHQSLFLLGVFLVALAGWGLFGFVAAYLVATAIGACWALLLVRRNFRVRPRANTTAWREIIKMSSAVGVISIVGTLYLKADSLMLSVMSGVSAVGIYGVAYSLVNVAGYLSGYIMTALIPGITTATQEVLDSIIQKAFHIMLVLACLIVGGTWLIKDAAVLLVSGPEFITASMPFAILSIATAFTYLNTLFSYATVALNKHHTMMYTSIATLVLNILLNLFMIPHFGIEGAAWSTVVSELVSVVFLYYIFWRRTGIAVNPKVACRPLLAAGAAFGIIVCVRHALDISDLLAGLILYGFAFVVLYGGILLAMGGMPEDIKAIAQKTISKFVPTKGAAK